jgi:hypothetical protein
LNSLHKKLNASNKQIEQLRQEVERYKNLTLATSFGNSTTRHTSHDDDDDDDTDLVRLVLAATTTRDESMNWTRSSTP